MSQTSHRIVVRIEVTTLTDENGNVSHEKMDRLAMILANIKNSGKKIMIVTSGAIKLGLKKLDYINKPVTNNDLQAIASVGQVDLIRLYKRYFDEYNQIVAQVLFASDTIENPERVNNAKNTFDNLLDMNIVPIINENDSVSTTDIELEDNYPLALNVAKIALADIILIKLDTNGQYIIQPKGNLKAKKVFNETDLLIEVNKICKELDKMQELKNSFPKSFEQIKV